jgi:hypothetical protein
MSRISINGVYIRILYQMIPGQEYFPSIYIVTFNNFDAWQHIFKASNIHDCIQGITYRYCIRCRGVTSREGNSIPRRTNFADFYSFQLMKVKNICSHVVFAILMAPAAVIKSHGQKCDFYDTSVFDIRHVFLTEPKCLSY